MHVDARPRRTATPLLLRSVVWLAALAACGGRPSGLGSEPGCQISAPTACPVPSPRYADVAPIIEQRCAGPCHNGVPDGPWPLTTYEHVADWADVVRDEVLTCRMPPVNAGIDMTVDERLALLSWVRCGFPE